MRCGAVRRRPSTSGLHAAPHVDAFGTDSLPNALRCTAVTCAAVYGAAPHVAARHRDATRCMQCECSLILASTEVGDFSVAHFQLHRPCFCRSLGLERSRLRAVRASETVFGWTATEGLGWLIAQSACTCRDRSVHSCRRRPTVTLGSIATRESARQPCVRTAVRAAVCRYQ